jgi:LysM repeat protein
MLGERYVVVKGDSLWKIAERKLGSGTQWPRIWKYNNRPEVVRATGRNIPNPDLIYTGQTLIIPQVPGTRPSAAPSGTPPVPHAEAGPERPAFTSSQPKSRATPAAPAPSGKGTTLSERLKTEKSPIALKYKLDDLRWPARDVGTAIIEVRMTGDIVLMTKKEYPVTYVTSRGELELQVTREANHAFGQLIEDSRFIYDPAKKQVTLRSMLVSQSGTPNTVSTAIGVEMNSINLVPKLRAEIRLPKLEGTLEPFRYVAMDVKIVIEITPKANPPRIDSPQPVVLTPVPESGTNWRKVIGVGLVVVAGAVVVGTLVEDFFTAGAGIADDPASFALAGASLTRGLAMIAGAAVVLPQAKVPANVQQKSSVTLGGSMQ